MDVLIDFPPARDVDALSFTDIVAAAYTGYELVGEMENFPDAGTYSADVLVLHFSGDLTPAEQEAVKLRLATTPNQETIIGNIKKAEAVNGQWLNRTVTPNLTQVTAQVDRVTKECNALLKLVLREFDSTSGT